MNYSQTISAAHDALKAGDLARVHTLCTPFCRLEKDHPEAREALARACFQDALSWFKNKNMRVADLRCRMAVALYPELAEGHHLLGVIAWTCGLAKPALIEFRRAAELNPEQAGDDLKRATAEFSDLSEVMQVAPMPLDGASRFLLIKAWGSGFFSEVYHVLGQCLMAELSGRTPVVHWGDNTLFGDEQDEGGDAFRYFFEPLSRHTVEDMGRLLTGGDTVYPPKWDAGNLCTENNALWQGEFSRLGPIHLLARPETVVVSDFFSWITELMPWVPSGHRWHGWSAERLQEALVKTYLTPAPWVLERADAFRAKHLNGPYIAVHIRGTDKEAENPDQQAINRRYDGLIDAILADFPQHKLFVLTDSAADLERLVAHHGERVVSADCERARGPVGVHFLPETCGRKLGEEVLLDALIGVGADRLIGNAHSNVSWFIAQYGDWAEGDVQLLGERDVGNLGLPLYALTTSQDGGAA